MVKMDGDGYELVEKPPVDMVCELPESPNKFTITGVGAVAIGAAMKRRRDHNHNVPRDNSSGRTL